MNTVLRRSDQDRTSHRLRMPAEASPLRNTNRITSNTADSKQNSVAQPPPSRSPGSSAPARPSSSQLAPLILPQPLPREQRFSAPLLVPTCSSHPSPATPQGAALQRAPPAPKSTPFPSQKTSRAVCVVQRLLERRRSLERVLCALMYRYAVLQAQARLRTTHTARRNFWGKPYDLIYSVFL